MIFNKARYQNKTKLRLSLWLKQVKHKLGYGVTNMNELQNSLQGKDCKGNISLSYSQNAFGLVLKEERQQSINTEHQKDELCINCGGKSW